MASRLQIEPGPKPQGRPLKEDGPDSKKRARLRRAQQAFQKRKQAAQEAQNRRLVTLESTVEQMSSIFMEFADTIIRSEALHSNAEILQKLLDTTKKFTALANETANDNVQKLLSSEDQQFPTADSEPGQSSFSSSSLTNVELAKPDLSAVLPFNIKNIQGSRVIGSQTILDDSLLPANFATADSNYPASHIMDPFDILNPLGNGWIDELPAPFTNYVGPSFRESSGLQIGLKLLQHTLNFAHDALRGILPAEISHRIFKFALLSYSKQELLYNLRWFLGPGHSEIYRLGNISPETGSVVPVLAPQNDKLDHEGRTLQNTHSENVLAQEESRYLNSAQAEKQQYLDAFGVEEYLRQKGARYVDSNTLELSLQGKPYASRPDGSGEEIVEIEDEHNLPISDVLASTQTSQSQPHASARHDHGLLSVFGFNAQSGNHKMIDNPSTTTQTPLNVNTPKPLVSQSRTHRVNLSLLLANLAYISVCLDTGPGFHRASLENAIQLSVVG